MLAASPGDQALLGMVLLAVLGVFFLADLVIFALWAAERGREQPILSRRWSVAHLILAIQAVVAAVFVVGCFASVIAVLGAPRGTYTRGGELPPQQMTAILVPAMLVQQAALVGVPLGIVRVGYGGWWEDLGLTPVRRHWVRLVPAGIALALALLPVVDLLETLCRRVLESGRVPYAAPLVELSKQADALSYLETLRAHPLGLAAFCLIVGIVGPIAEEVFFRGFAYRVFRHRFGRPVGLVLSAALFAAIHVNPVGLIPIFLIGLVLAGLYERTGNLAASIGLHCANNTASLAFYFLAPGFSLWEGILPK